MRLRHRLAGLLARLFGDRRGASAVEFALIVPILAAGATLTYDLWTGSQGVLAMRAGVEAGAQYIRAGGSNDAAAKAIALAAWKTKPADAQVSVTRACKCGDQVNVCTGLCSNQSVPSVYVTLKAQGTGKGAFLSQSLKDEQVVRVR